MTSFQRGTFSLNSYCQFLNIDLCVFLENEKDLYFWKKVFKEIFPRKKIHFESITTCSFIEDKGRGKESLKKLAIEHGMGNLLDSKLYIAWDKDLEIFLNDTPDNIITTYGYTLENSLFCPHRLTNIILEDVPLNIGKYDEVVTKINTAFENYKTKLKELVIFNLGAKLKNLEGNEIPSIMGRTPFSFLSENVPKQLDKPVKKLDNEKIERKIENLRTEIGDQFIERARRLYDECSLQTRYVISGHFLEQLVIYEIESIIRGYKEAVKSTLSDPELSTKYEVKNNKDFLKRVNDKCYNYCKNRSSCEDIRHLTENISRICSLA